MIEADESTSRTSPRLKIRSSPHPACRVVPSVQVPKGQLWDDDKPRKAERFAYGPLQASNPNSIRLVEVLPGKDKRQICCRLVEADINEGPGYEAVSYVWGNQGWGAAEILVNDAPFRVTSNLYGALRTIRSRDVSKRLWVDAICINQDDERERSAQVRVMRSIYEHAERVLVWLGPDDADDESAVELINFLDANHVSPGPESCKNVKLKQWGALFRFFELPYFCRTWIIQEIQANPNTLVMCGQAKTTYSAIESAACVALLGTDEILQRMITDRGISNARYIRTLMAPDATLLSRLSQTRGFFASDERDKVFAFLRPEDTMVPDYSISECQVFQAAACQMLLENGLETLSYVVRQDLQWFHWYDDELPSWVPKFDEPFILPFCKVRGLRAGGSPDDTKARCYQVEGNELKISSVLVDRIAVVYPLFRWSYFQLPGNNDHRLRSNQVMPTFMDWLWEEFAGVEVTAVGPPSGSAASGAELLSHQSLAEREKGRKLRVFGSFRRWQPQPAPKTLAKPAIPNTVSHLPVCPTRREFATTITAGLGRRGLSHINALEHEEAFLDFSRSLFSSVEDFDSRLDRELREVEFDRYSVACTCAPRWWDEGELIDQATKFVNDNGGAKASSAQSEAEAAAPQDHSDDYDAETTQNGRLFQRAAQTACNNRCLFLTEAGRLGLGPAALEPAFRRDGRVWDKKEGKAPGYKLAAIDESDSSDLLAPFEIRIFPGAATPFITRCWESSKSYVLVGECYVYGMMDGQGLESGRGTQEEITIR